MRIKTHVEIDMAINSQARAGLGNIEDEGCTLGRIEGEQKRASHCIGKGGVPS